MYKFNRLLIIAIFFLGIALNASAQTKVTITGKVTDSQTQQPLIGANVFIEALNMGASSDAEGKFSFNVPPGKYIVSASYIGYDLDKTLININNESPAIELILTPQILEGQKVIVTATRAKERETPVVFTDISNTDISEKYWAQDIPMLIDDVPGVYSYSDAGNGIGYSYLKIRGFDQKRVSVMLNGIPLNDPEDHQVYWVDVPDFITSVQDIQIQRGVGSSIYGSSSFGGSVNVVTHELNTPQKIVVSTGMGSYNTQKASLNINSGLINNQYAVAARFSKITTDGYRNNSGVDMWAYFLSAARYGLKTMTKLNVYGGPETTHAAWEASAESELEENHQHNPYTYANTIDNFQQPHYELLHEWKISPKVTFNNTFFYIQGKGYYEGYKTGEDLIDFGYQPFSLNDSTLITETDLVRQKWVNKDQLGWISRVDWEHKNGELIFGTDFYTFKSEHWGQVTWAAQLPPGSYPNHSYHRYNGKKKFGSVFAHELYRLTPKLMLMADMNLQLQKYEFIQREEGNFKGENRHGFEVDYTFFNPKIGLNYNVSESINFFGNISMAHREPTDTELFNIWQGPDDLGVQPLFEKSTPVYKANGEINYLQWENPLVKPEKLIDFELGSGFQSDWLFAKVNLYWMNFENEIVPYSQVDKDGFPIQGNADKTVHRGVETSLGLTIIENLALSGGFSVSQNYFSEFNLYEEMWDDDWNFLGTQTVDFSGKTIAGFPGIMANGKLSYRIGSLLGAVQFQHIGEQYLDNTENENRKINAYSLVNLLFSYELKTFPGISGLKFRIFVNNLLDERYETAGYYDSWAGENFYWPGAGRNIFLNLEISL